MKLLLISLFCCFTLSTFAQSDAQTVLDKFEKADMAMGAAAAYSMDGETVWASSFGYADEAAQRKFEVNTPTRIASIAKPFTAIAIMQLVEQGKIDLDAPIQTYLPDYPKSDLGTITTRHLLSHTSGMGAYANKKEAKNTTTYATIADATTVFRDRKLENAPGTAFGYTTYGYVVLGLVIEKVSGQRYEEYIKTNIFDKVGMTNTVPDQYRGGPANKSKLYVCKKPGKIKKSKPNDLSNRLPGGGYISTTEDLIKFGNAVLNHTLVSEETQALMTQHHSLEKVNNSYGFGWYLYGQAPDVGGIIGHTGAQNGSSCQLFIVPSRNLVVVVLANTQGALRYVSKTGGKLMGVALKN